MRLVKFFLFIILSMGFITPMASAKRSAPVRVEPVVYNNIRYTAPIFSQSSGHKQLGGYIEAWDIKTNKKLWELKVYDIKYDPGLERDVQEIYIDSLRIDLGHLIVTNEAGEEYEVELATQRVKKRSNNRSKESVLVK